MADTIRELIIQDIVAALESLSGYGEVYRGRTYFSPDELPAVSVLPGIESGEKQYGAQILTMPVQVHAVQVVGDNNPSELSETVLGDLIDVLIYGAIDRINGMTYTGGGVEDYPDEDDQAVSVQISIEIEYSTVIGDPYNQTSM